MHEVTKNVLWVAGIGIVIGLGYKYWYKPKSDKKKATLLTDQNNEPVLTKGTQEPIRRATTTVASTKEPISRSVSVGDIKELFKGKFVGARGEEVY